MRKIVAQAGVRGSASLLLLVGCCALAFAAPPKVNYLYPAGGQRGQSFVVTAAGDFANWPANAWVDRPGVTVVAEKDKGKFRVDATAAAAPGVFWLRFHDGEGAAALRPLILGELPEIEETEPNDTPAKPQELTGSVVVNGRLGKAGDADLFAIALQKGQTLAAAVQTSSLLGSPADAIVQICEVVERKTSSVAGSAPQVEAFVVEQNHDAVGLDPLATFVAPRDGRYLVRLFAYSSVPSTSLGYSGGDDYVYRLTITTTGLVNHALPLAVTGNAAAEVQLYGAGLVEAKSRVTLPEFVPPADPLFPPDLRTADAFLAQVAGAIVLPRVEEPSLIAAETARPAEPQEISLPTMISGCLAAAKQTHVFRFTAKKGEKLELRLESRALGFPLHGLLAIVDASGKRLVESPVSEKQVDPSLDWTAPADGQYQVQVRDLNHRGGPRYAYRLSLAVARPDFALTLAADTFAVAPGKTVEIPVTIARRSGFDKPIALRVVGLPEGVTAAPATSEGKGESAKSVKLVLSAAEGIEVARGFSIRIEGVVEGERPLIRSARFPVALPLAEPHWAVWLTIVKP